MSSDNVDRVMKDLLYTIHTMSHGDKCRECGSKATWRDFKGNSYVCHQCGSKKLTKMPNDYLWVGEGEYQ